METMEMAKAPADVGGASETAGQGTGLLSQEETLSILREVLGDVVPEARLRAAAAALDDAVAARWELLPPEINPDMGFNFFVVCRETCWFARQILIEGVTFRIFRQRD